MDTTTIPPQHAVDEGDTVTVEYTSARTGNPQEWDARVEDVVPFPGDERSYRLKLRDTTRNRTVRVTVHAELVESRERRGHYLTLGVLTDLTVQ